jgi:hypothetical protein
VIELQVLSRADERRVHVAHERLAQVVDAMQRVGPIWVLDSRMGVQLKEIGGLDDVVADTLLFALR